MRDSREAFAGRREDRVAQRLAADDLDAVWRSTMDRWIADMVLQQVHLDRRLPWKVLCVVVIVRT